ncbi:MAG: class I SAM-dependent methyltransferase, partial [Planctomycetes bacterium]|nr:class I SAM-dependent methyltransferase [Planctomycetota bacterium]
MSRMYPTVLALALLGIGAATVFAQPPGRRGGRGGDGPPPDRGNPLLRIFDTNRDGVLSEDEISQAGAKLKELDKSKDGKVSGEEIREALPMGGGRGGFGPAGAPFGPGGPGRGPAAATAEDSGLQAEPLAKDDQEKKVLDALDEMRRGERFRNVSPTDGRLLRLLAEAIGAKNIVEIGTSTGESGVYFAQALKSTGGHLYTHEIDEERAKTAQENFKKAGVDDLVTIILGDAHETIKQHKDPTGILFLDADKDGYIDYLNKLLPLLRPGGLVIAHNMNARMADPKFVAAINENPELETLILLKEGTGVSVTLK